MPFVGGSASSRQLLRLYQRRSYLLRKASGVTTPACSICRRDRLAELSEVQALVERKPGAINAVFRSLFIRGGVFFPVGLERCHVSENFVSPLLCCCPANTSGVAGTCKTIVHLRKQGLLFASGYLLGRVRGSPAIASVFRTIGVKRGQRGRSTHALSLFAFVC